MTMYTVALAVIQVGVLFALLYLASKLDPDHTPLKVFLLVLAVWMLPLSIGLASSIATDAGAASGVTNLLTSSYRVASVVAVVSTAWIIIYYFYTLILFMNDIVTKKNEAKKN